MKITIPFSNICLLRWKPNVISSIHNHPNVNCNYMILKGTIRENIYKQTNSDGYYLIESKIINKHQCSYINDDIGSHSIENLSDKPSWSIHYYPNVSQ